MAEPTVTDHNRSPPDDVGERQIGTHCPIPTRRWVPPAEHAAAILEFLRGPGGRTGSVPYAELKQLHVEICAERDWDPIGWTAVGRELGDLLKENKRTYEKGKRVYRIPPLPTRPAQMKAI